MTNPAANNTCSPEVASREALKLCPHCGAKAVMSYVSDFRISSPRTGRRVMCTGCGAMTGAVAYEHEAIEAWNRRAPDGAREAALEEAAKLCEDFAISDDDLDVMAGRIRALAAKTGAK